jgi:hypothetical protein
MVSQNRRLCVWRGGDKDSVRGPSGTSGSMPEGVELLVDRHAPEKARTASSRTGDSRPQVDVSGADMRDDSHMEGDL